MELDQLQENLRGIVDSFSNNNEVQILAKLVTEIKTFVHYIEKVDKTAADEILKELESTTDNTLFNEVGKLLRRFHDQLVLIREGIPEDLGKIASQDVIEMSERLQMIVTMTDKAANTTLDLTEEVIDSLVTQNTTVTEIQDDLQSLLKTENLPPAVVETITASMDKIQTIASDNDGLQAKLTDILIAQDYQDLTGQVIYKVINLLKSLESDLAQLIDRFGQIINDNISDDETTLKGPLEESHEDKSSQSDVDALLNKFGF